MNHIFLTVQHSIILHGVAAPHYIIPHGVAHPITLYYTLSQHPIAFYYTGWQCPITLYHTGSQCPSTFCYRGSRCPVSFSYIKLQNRVSFYFTEALHRHHITAHILSKTPVTHFTNFNIFTLAFYLCTILQLMVDGRWKLAPLWIGQGRGDSAVEWAARWGFSCGVGSEMGLQLWSGQGGGASAV